MNTKKLLQLRETAERTIKILDLIKAGKNSPQIVQVFANDGEVVNRQLVDYYIKATK